MEQCDVRNGMAPGAAALLRLCERRGGQVERGILQRVGQHELVEQWAVRGRVAGQKPFEQAVRLPGWRTMPIVSTLAGVPGQYAVLCRRMAQPIGVHHLVQAPPCGSEHQRKHPPGNGHAGEQVSRRGAEVRCGVGVR